MLYRIPHHTLYHLLIYFQHWMMTAVYRWIKAQSAKEPALANGCAFLFQYDVGPIRLQQTESSRPLRDARGQQERGKGLCFELGWGRH